MQPTVRLQGLLINLFSDYLPVHCQWMPFEKPPMSYALGPIPPGTHPLYFDVEYGRVAERWRYAMQHMPRRGPLKPVLGSHRGLYDLFIPVRGADKQNAGHILFGGFHLALPERAELWKRWCSLRRAPGPDDEQDFLAYARTLLEVPVLTRPVWHAVAELLGKAGPALLGQGGVEAAITAIQDAKRRILGSQLPWRMWHYAEARRDRYHRGPFQGTELARWDAEEFKLKRGPDTAVALVMRDADVDPVEALCAATRLQWACFELARQEGGLVAGRLGGEGALLLAAGTRLQARDLALKASQALSKRLGSRVVAAFRSYPKQPALLEKAIREAEAGLRLGLAQGQELLEAGTLEAQSADLETLSQDLAAALAAGRTEEQRLVRGALGSGALQASQGRPEILRVNLRWCLGPALKRLPELKKDIDRRFQAAGNAQDLLRLFATLCDELAFRSSSPAQGDLRLRLRQAAGRLQSRPEEESSLESLARESGLSKFHFSRLFKQNSGLGFAQARQEARLAKARRLLSEGNLSISAVASECGFKNSSYFSTIFRRSEGLSPRNFRHNKTKNI